ncbi:hypothetical protein Ocin01_01424 [Orchesella cincta]|uniref:Uncharacterized protein n=1 Tax=Orchesella cincta TaxID=48709 RepID=A0A1D2NJ22_ORCCI|nr:hypothetical protein Ocin01_01424 [Orchesella cincta]
MNFTRLNLRSLINRGGPSCDIFWKRNLTTLVGASHRHPSSCAEDVNRQNSLTCGALCRRPNAFWLHTPVRLLHSSGGDKNELDNTEQILPSLMPFPQLVWPKFINAIRNWFFINFIIKPYFDKEFSMNDFILGVKEAVSVVSNKLSEGKLDELEGLVEASALTQLRESLSKFTVFQQQLLRVASEDIFFAFPYQIGIIIPDELPRDQYPEGVKPPPQTRHVEITVCLHVLRGLAERQRKGETGSAFNFQEFTQDERNKYNVMICNYRFFKDFTEGSQDPTWIVNIVNHFLPAEVNVNRK